MRVLVTGSTGFLGSRLCQALVAQGHTVRAFHRASSSLAGLAGLPVEHAIGDLTQPETLALAMQGVEVVYHTAALLGAESYPGQLHDVTVMGTRAVMEAAFDAQVRRVVHTSSIAALGVPSTGPFANGTRPLINESHTWNYDAARWPYGAAKYQAELEVQKAVAKGLDAVIVNPAYVLGAGDIYWHTGSIIMLFAQGRVPAILHGGLNIVHIDDVTEGHLAAYEYGKSGERYILGGENLTIQQFVQMTSRIVGIRSPSIIIPNRVAQAAPATLKLLRSILDLPFGDELLLLAGRYFYMDISKSLRELRLNAPRTAESAIREAYQWFGAHKSA